MSPLRSRRMVRNARAKLVARECAERILETCDDPEIKAEANAILNALARTLN